MAVIGLFGSRPASAATLSASGEVHLSGKVAPAHYVIVDGSGTILTIMSNTDQDTVPLIYKDKLAAPDKIPLTPAIYDQYLKIVPSGTSHAGVLYKSPNPSPAGALSSDSGGAVLARTSKPNVQNNPQAGFEKLLNAAFPGAQNNKVILADFKINSPGARA